VGGLFYNQPSVRTRRSKEDQVTVVQNFQNALTQSGCPEK
jgi:hypothetical protein